MRKIVASVALTLVVLALAAVLFIHSGLYNVAATEAHAPVISWALGTTREHSVRRRARDIPVPPLTADHAQAGSKLYASLCLTCHALPHTEGGELGEGLMPRPPDAGAIARHLAPAEMFWITLNGIRMTGMPAFAGRIDEDEAWSIVAYLHHQPKDAAPSAGPERSGTEPVR